MIAALAVLLVSVIPAIFIAEAIAKRRRRARWMQGRPSVPDDQFYTSPGPAPVSRNAAIRVRLEIGHATKMPADLIAASDSIQELDAIGDGSHPTVIDYFTDFLLVEEPRNESTLVSVRDLVIEFGPQLDNRVSDEQRS